LKKLISYNRAEVKHLESLTHVIQCAAKDPQLFRDRAMEHAANALPRKTRSAQLVTFLLSQKIPQRSDVRHTCSYHLSSVVLNRDLRLFLVQINPE